LSAVAAPPAPQAAFAVDYDSINKSIVWVNVTWQAQVDVTLDDGSGQTHVQTFDTKVSFNCTGWFVSNTGDIATAAHCVETDPDKIRAAYANVISEQGLTGVPANEADWPVQFEPSPLIEIGQPVGIEGGPLSDKNFLTAQLVDKQTFQTGDNALLRIANMKDTPALPVSTKTPEVGDNVTSIGFAGLTAKTSDELRQLPSYRSGHVSSPSSSDRGVPRTEIDIDVIQGMSGGPTINENGEVVGINSFLVSGNEAQGEVQSSQVNFITDTQTLRDFLGKNQVNLQAAPAATENAQSAAAPVAPASENAATIPGWMIATVAVLAAALLALIAYIVISRRKQQRPPAG
jgi:S1-C subfamily serine protease